MPIKNEVPNFPFKRPGAIRHQNSQFNRRDVLKTVVGLGAVAALPNLVFGSEESFPVNWVPAEPGTSSRDFDARYFGAVGDGYSDDGSAIQAAIDAAHINGGGRVWLSRGGSYLTYRPLILKSSVELCGSGSVQPELRTGTPLWALIKIGANAIDTRITGIRLAGAGQISSALVRTTGAMSSLRIFRCLFTDDSESPKSQTAGLRIGEAGSTTITVKDSVFKNVAYGVLASEAVNYLRIEGCEFTRWKQSAIQVKSSSDQSAERVSIVNNRLYDPENYTISFPIQVGRSDGPPVKNVFITDNQIVGLGVAFREGGTPDQIALQGVHGFVVSGNITKGGGENGMSISRTSSNGVVRNNRAEENFGHGITVGSGFAILSFDSVEGWQVNAEITGEGSGAAGQIERIIGNDVWVRFLTRGIFRDGERVVSDQIVRDIVKCERGRNIFVRENACLGNGLHIAGKGGVYSGIYCQQVENVVLTENVCQDFKSLKTQSYGAIMAQVTTGRVYNNDFTGNGQGEVLISGQTTLV